MGAFVTYFGRDIAWRATNRLRSEMTLHVLRLDFGFHGAHTPGELLERIDGDIERLANFFSQFFVQIVGAFVLLRSLVVVTGLEDWRFGLAVAGFASFFLLTQFLVLKYSIPLWHAESVARAELYGLISEQFSGVAEIQNAVDRLLEGRTAIVIAHRLATVEQVDQIMVIEDGRIREHGSREALARDPSSRFEALLETGLEETLA